MTDKECVAFLQWALPRMRMRWAGFRKVRLQVCKRISRRIAALGLSGTDEYRAYIEADPEEWKTLASLCRVTISRFYRDRSVFDHIGNVVLPRLAKRAREDLSCWSIGCASGEEAYTLRILWELRVAPGAGQKTLHVLGTDSDPALVERARRAIYPASALKDMPTELATEAFEQSRDELVLRERFKEGVTFEVMDILDRAPGGPFDMILCRNLVFTYFDEDLQQEILPGLLNRLHAGGVLVVGAHEKLPGVAHGLRAETAEIFEKAR